jgi:hypothetical protein
MPPRGDRFRDGSPVPSGPAGPRQQQVPGPRLPDRNRCPAGWDAELWHLTLLFEQYAHEDGIELRAGRPVIYAELAELVKRWHVKEKTYHQEITGCPRRELALDRADHCWYHWPPKAVEQQVARDLTWVEVVEIIMAEFWSRVQDEYALDQFRRDFRTYGLAMVKHWHSLRVKRSVAESRVSVPRPVMRRRVPGGTMPGTSKEG